MEAVELGFVDELVKGEVAEGGGVKAVSAEEGEKGREDIWVAVDEDWWLSGSGYGERSKEGGGLQG